jgi:hypothetical protein
MPDLTPLNSTNLEAAGVDGDDLVISFKNGSTYRYPGASGHFDSLLAAESPGSYFAKFIRNEYPFRRM